MLSLITSQRSESPAISPYRPWNISFGISWDASTSIRGINAGFIGCLFPTWKLCGCPWVLMLQKRCCVLLRLSGYLDTMVCPISVFATKRSQSTSPFMMWRKLRLCWHKPGDFSSKLSIYSCRPQSYHMIVHDPHRYFPYSH